MTEIKKYTCIVCPKGCEISVKIVDGIITDIVGHTCKRGEIYARSEVVSPMRTLTTTAAVYGGGVVPVRTDKAIPKEILFEAVKEIAKYSIPQSAKAGYVIIENLFSTGAKVYTTADADRGE